MPHSGKRPRTEVPESEIDKIKDLDAYQFEDMQDAEVFYVPDFVDESTAAQWYTGLLELDSCTFMHIVVVHERIAYATDENLKLKYSGQQTVMNYTYPPLLRQIQDEVEGKLGVKFNHVLLNLYENGSIYIGKHRDNVEERVIAAVSLGAPRTFVMAYDPLNGAKTNRPTAKRARSEPTPPLLKKRWTLKSGSLVVMQGDTQLFWKHEIPK
ncbi:hypothetical protein H0H92_012643 [Tricholoma furcatifolium]|nr:hypothetical protein H0H92_012643 [Tricholoma furcatifolium]